MNNQYNPPSWTGKPEAGLHLDIMKDNKLIQKLMVDEKKCYLFGRNPELNEFSLNHASCSRLHAALIYHKHLKRNFLVDLGSRHGTFIGKTKLEPNQPTQLPIDTKFHFGESTRIFILREKPVQVQVMKIEGNLENSDKLCSLPENEIELDNLTEFNTAHNMRISTLRINDNNLSKNKKKKKSVHFLDEEEVINPEDIDPTIGKFRNLIQSSVVVPKKKRKLNFSNQDLVESLEKSNSSLLNNLNKSSLINPLLSNSLSFRLAFNLPNSVPDTDIEDISNFQINQSSSESYLDSRLLEKSSKKKYAKETWPGRKTSMLN